MPKNPVAAAADVAADAAEVVGVDLPKLWHVAGAAFAVGVGLIGAQRAVVWAESGGIGRTMDRARRWLGGATGAASAQVVQQVRPQVATGYGLVIGGN